MLDLLVAGDHKACRKFWAEKVPAMPQPASDEAAEIVMHQARTMTPIPLKLRLWSHRWLQERSLPSLLPEEFIPMAEKLEVIRKGSVGISINSQDPIIHDALGSVQKDMEVAVLDMADSNGSLIGVTGVAERIEEVKQASMKKLFGRRDVG